MNLIPIMYLSLMIFGGLFLVVLVVSYIASKLKSNKKPYEENYNSSYSERKIPAKVYIMPTNSANERIGKSDFAIEKEKREVQEIKQNKPLKNHYSSRLNTSVSNRPKHNHTHVKNSYSAPRYKVVNYTMDESSDESIPREAYFYKPVLEGLSDRQLFSFYSEK